MLFFSVHSWSIVDHAHKPYPYYPNFNHFINSLFINDLWVYLNFSACPVCVQFYEFCSEFC